MNTLFHWFGVIQNAYIFIGISLLILFALRSIVVNMRVRKSADELTSRRESMTKDKSN